MLMHTTCPYGWQPDMPGIPTARTQQHTTAHSLQPAYRGEAGAGHSGAGTPHALSRVVTVELVLALYAQARGVGVGGAGEGLRMGVACRWAPSHAL